jgi:hypothetical protein
VKGHIKLRKGELAKEADKPGPKRYAGRTAPLACGAATFDESHRSIGPNHSVPFFSIGNWVSPTSPTSVVARPQGRGMGRGVNDVGGSEGRPVTGRIGLREQGYPTRKGADFRRVLRREALITSWPLEKLDDGTCSIERTLGRPHGWRRLIRGGSTHQGLSRMKGDFHVRF